MFLERYYARTIFGEKHLNFQCLTLIWLYDGTYDSQLNKESWEITVNALVLGMIKFMPVVFTSVHCLSNGNITVYGAIWHVIMCIVKLIRMTHILPLQSDSLTLLWVLLLCMASQRAYRYRWRQIDFRAWRRSGRTAVPDATAVSLPQHLASEHLASLCKAPHCITGCPASRLSGKAIISDYLVISQATHIIRSEGGRGAGNFIIWATAAGRGRCWGREGEAAGEWAWGSQRTELRPRPSASRPVARLRRKNTI